MKPWNRNAPVEWLDVLFDYVPRVPFIPEDVYELIQAFFEYYNYSGLETLWMKIRQDVELANFMAYIKNLQRNLLNQLIANVKIITDNAKRTNMILIKLCMMIYIQPEYQNSMQYVANGVSLEQQVQYDIVETLLQLFLHRSACLDLNDEHFIRILKQFMFFLKNQMGLQELINILQCVVTGLICICSF